MKRAIAIFVVGLMMLGQASAEGGTKVPPTATTPIGRVVSCTTIVHAASVSKGTLLTCLDGGKGMPFESLRGPVVVNVWGSWCGPCVEEIPHFRALAALKKVRIVGIDVEERNMDIGKNFLISHGMNWPNLYDPDGRTKKIFGFGVPVTWFINAAGKVVYRQIGTIHSDKIIFDLVSKYLKVKI